VLRWFVFPQVDLVSDHADLVKRVHLASLPSELVLGHPKAPWHSSSDTLSGVRLREVLLLLS
jgi:hypothetical protein